MELYNLITNIRNTNKEQEIKKVIDTVRNNLSNLTEERTCFIYSSYLYQELQKNNINSRIVSTKDLLCEYEHRFVLVPDNIEEETYFLIDLTYSQFDKKEPLFDKLLKDGYQQINNDLWNFYLSQVTREEKGISSSLSDAYFGINNSYKNKSSY